MEHVSNDHSVQIQVGQESMHLLPEKAIWLPERTMLLVADLHLGKVSHFRKHGLAIPSQAEGSDLARLHHLCEIYNPQALILLGDLFHSDHNRSWDDFAAWALEVPFRIVLVQGNHDILTKAEYDASNIQCCAELHIGSLWLTHDPREPAGGLINISGHLHPGVVLQGRGRQRLRLPCFFIRQNSLIMPAFSEFTGLHIPAPQREDQIYAIAEGRVIKVL